MRKDAHRRELITPQARSMGSSLLDKQYCPSHGSDAVLDPRDAGHVFEGTECAWKLWLDVEPGVTVLDLGCGYGARAVSLARHGARIIAVETHLNQANATRERLFAEAHSDAEEHAVLTVSRLDRLPLQNKSVDIALLPGDASCVATPGDAAEWLGSQRLTSDLCEEVRRVLRSNGQVVLKRENRWAFDRLVEGVRHWLNLGRYPQGIGEEFGPRLPTRRGGISWFGCKRLLRLTGATPAYDLSLWRDRGGTLDGIRECGDRMVGRNPGSLKRRLRTSRYFVPEFALVGKRLPGRGACLFDRILSTFARHLTQRLGRDAFPSVERSYVSRKDKLVLDVTVGGVPAIVRVALSPGSQSSEERAFQLLKHLSDASPGESWFPHALTQGRVNGVFFAAEERLPGRALKHRHALYGPECLEIASRLLERMNPGLSEHPPTCLEGELFDRFVTQPLKRVFSVLDQPRTHEKLYRALHDELYGATVSVGLTHGDFSVSNVLVDDKLTANLIDWEDGEVRGLPILDTFNFLQSRRRALAGAIEGDRERPSSLIAVWPEDDMEERFLVEQYARCRMSPNHHSALGCVHWLSIVYRLMAFSFMQRPENFRFYIKDPLEEYLGSSGQEGDSASMRSHG